MLNLCVFMSVCICLCHPGACNTFRWLVCPPSGRSASVTDKYLAVEGSEQWICCLTIIQCVLLCHSFSHVSAGTLSVCVSEKTADLLLHTVALQFLCALFTEETKSQSVEVTNANSSFTEIVVGPSASQLCELLLQVCGVGHVVWSRWPHFVLGIKVHFTKYWCYSHDSVWLCFVLVFFFNFFFLPEFWEEGLPGPFEEADGQSSDDTVSLQSHSSEPCSQRYSAKPQAAARQSPAMSFLKNFKRIINYVRWSSMRRV